MAPKSRKKKRSLKQIHAKLMKIAKHGEDCRCRDWDCIELRRYTKKWRKKMQPRHDAIRDSGRITAADLAIVINTRA